MTSVTLEHGQTTVVIREVPAQLCENCGEAYLSESATREVMAEAASAGAAGDAVVVRRYAA